MIFNSIRGRLQLWYGLILVAVLAGFGVTAYQMERGRQLRRMDGELQRRVNWLAGALRPPPRSGGRLGEGAPPEKSREPRPPFDGPFGKRPPEPNLENPPRNLQLPAAATNLFDTGDANSFYYVIWWRDGRELARSANAPAEIRAPTRAARGELPPPAGPPPRERANLPEPSSPQTRGVFREASILTQPGEIVLVGRSITTEMGELRLVAVRLAAVAGAVLLLGLAGGWWIATRAIQPIDDISAAAMKISAGDLTRRIHVADTDNELGRLAGVLNSTFARLATAFAQQRQFTSDAAHELRTPVSVILTQVQSTLNKERSGAEYRESLEACQRAAQRMRRLTESLLALARTEAGTESIKRTRFDLAETARECVELIRPLASEGAVKLIPELTAVECCGEAGRLAQVITNLLINAIQYNRESGEVRLRVQREGGLAVLTVADTGRGISTDDLPHVFERFFRADRSRTGSAGHAGLGLAISKAIVEAHAGTIEIASQLGAGTIVTVRLPTGTAGV